MVPSFTQLEYFTLVLSDAPANPYAILYMTVVLSWAETYYHLAHYSTERDRLREGESEYKKVGDNSLVIHKITSELSVADERAILGLKIFYIIVLVLLSSLSVLSSFILISVHKEWITELKYIYIWSMSSSNCD
jgi:hypothetical protein